MKMMMTRMFMLKMTTTTMLMMPRMTTMMGRKPRSKKKWEAVACPHIPSSVCIG